MPDTPTTVLVNLLLLSALLDALILSTMSWHFFITARPSAVGTLATHVGLVGRDGPEEGEEGDGPEGDGPEEGEEGEIFLW